MSKNLPKKGTVLWRLIKIMELMPDHRYIHLSTIYLLIPDVMKEHIRGELNKNTLRGKWLFKRSRVGKGNYRLSNEGRLLFLI